MTLGVVCAGVGILAALGVFNSIFNFPLIFAGVCLVLGLLTVWRERERPGALTGGGVLLLGVVLAVAGWMYQGRVVEANVERREATLESTLLGRAVPPPLDLVPLAGSVDSWNEAATLQARATVVAFWARWCSPCAKEMPLIQDLYASERGSGLQALAITRYEGSDGDAREREARRAATWLADREITFPAAITDREEVYESFGAFAVPTTVLLDGNGRVVDVALGLESSKRLLQTARDMVALR